MSKFSDDKILPIFLFGMLIIGGAYALFISFRDKNNSKPESPPAIQTSPTSTTPSQKAEPATTSAQSVKTYTMEEVAAHGADPDSEECWTVIHDKVYDILDFATNSHPGGEIIFEACGKDATKLFETRPMGSKTPHSENARKILEKYYIGDLKK